MRQFYELEKSNNQIRGSRKIGWKKKQTNKQTNQICITSTNLTAGSLPSRNQRPYTGSPNKTDTGAWLGFFPLNLLWDTNTWNRV